MASLMKKEMDFEFAFAKAGGLLLAGPDPTGNGGVLAGFGDQREVELLVEADSRRSRPFTLRPKTARSISASRIASARLRRASRRIWC
jgi:hypothetical protein